MRAFFLLVVLAACDALTPPPEREAPADVTLTTVALSQWNAGRLEARAQIDTLEYHRSEARALAHGLVAHPIENDRSSGRLEARRAIARTRQGLVQFEGGVRWQAEGGDEARTEACTLELGSGRVEGRLPVTLTGPDYVMTGARFEAELRGERRWTLLDGVEGRLEELR